MLCTVERHHNAVQYYKTLHKQLQAEYQSYVESTKDTPYLAVSSELWGVFSEYLWENWTRFNDISLRVFVTVKTHCPDHLIYDTYVIERREHTMAVFQRWITHVIDRTFIPTATQEVVKRCYFVRNQTIFRLKSAITILAVMCIIDQHYRLCCFINSQS